MELSLLRKVSFVTDLSLVCNFLKTGRYKTTLIHNNMKKIILILTVAALTFVSCKKETIEPTPVYSIEFLAGYYPNTANYTDIVIKVNGDSIGVLTTHTTTLNAEDVAKYYELNKEFPIMQTLVFEAYLDSLYNIEAYTLSGELIGSTGEKLFKLVPDNDFDGDKPWLTDDVYTADYTANVSSQVGANGNDCTFLGIDKTLLLIFEIEN